MSFGGFYGPTSEAELMRALARALDLGVDFWDTANVYGDGLCERLIGKFLAEDPGRRRKVTLATKFAIRRRDDGARFFDNSAAHIREALEGSMKRLGVDHIDLYYVHRVDKRDSDRGHGRRTGPAGQSGLDRRDRPLGSGARHPKARTRRASDRRRSVGIFAVDAQSRARPHSGVRGS